MTFAQVKPFDQAKGGTAPNWCLANVVKGYSISNRYGDAWKAWQETEQHTDQPPTGLDVPVFFSYFATIDGQYKNWGHIGVRLSSGKFWSDGKVYNTIKDYTDRYAPKYVGWGESVNEYIILKKEASMSNPAILTLEANVAISIATTGKQPSTSEEKQYINKPAEQYILDNFITFWSQRSRVPALEARIKDLESQQAYIEAGVIDGVKMYKRKA